MYDKNTWTKKKSRGITLLFVVLFVGNSVLVLMASWSSFWSIRLSVRMANMWGWMWIMCNRNEICGRDILYSFVKFCAVRMVTKPREIIDHHLLCGNVKSVWQLGYAYVLISIYAYLWLWTSSPSSCMYEHFVLSLPPPTFRDNQNNFNFTYSKKLQQWNYSRLYGDWISFHMNLRHAPIHIVCEHF